MTLAFDGTAQTGSSATNTLVIGTGLTTTNANDVIVAIISAASGSATVPTVSSISGTATTGWVNRKTLSGTALDYGFAAGDGTMLAVWWARTLRRFRPRSLPRP
jgi:hypothetical protein